MSSFFPDTVTWACTSGPVCSGEPHSAVLGSEHWLVQVQELRSPRGLANKTAGQKFVSWNISPKSFFNGKSIFIGSFAEIPTTCMLNVSYRCFYIHIPYLQLFILFLWVLWCQSWFLPYQACLLQDSLCCSLPPFRFEMNIFWISILASPNCLFFSLFLCSNCIEEMSFWSLLETHIRGVLKMLLLWHKLYFLGKHFLIPTCGPFFELCCPLVCLATSFCVLIITEQVKHSPGTSI